MSSTFFQYKKGYRGKKCLKYTEKKKKRSLELLQKNKFRVQRTISFFSNNKTRNTRFLCCFIFLYLGLFIPSSVVLGSLLATVQCLSCIKLLQSWLWPLHCSAGTKTRQVRQPRFSLDFPGHLKKRGNCIKMYHGHITSGLT